MDKRIYGNGLRTPLLNFIHTCVDRWNYVCNVYYMCTRHYIRMQKIFHKEGLYVLPKRFWLEFRDAFFQNFRCLGWFKSLTSEPCPCLQTLWRKKTEAVFLCVWWFCFQPSVGPAGQCLNLLCTMFKYREICPDYCLATYYLLRQKLIKVICLLWETNCNKFFCVIL